MRYLAKRFGIVVPAVLCLLTLHSVALADENNLGSHVMRALPLGDASPPKIDGRLDDAVWAKAVPVSGFTQKEPYFGQPASEDTEIRIVYSRTHLYVGARCFAKPEKIIKQLSRRDNAYASDAFAIFLDSRHDHRTGYKFACNALGVQQDSYRYEDSRKDISWDGFWRCETSIDNLGWIAEFEIPMSNLRFPDQEQHVWGINFERWFRDGESTAWKPISPDDGGTWRMSSLAHLVGIAHIRQGKHLEITPYTTAWLSQHGEEKASGKPDFGFDAKYGITTNLRANLTVNPDFAQVEADLIEINLSRFPTWLPEKRLFFMEGNSVFSTPMELFYSRRIGTQGDILWGTKL
ncbi:MAG: carbohydrate binding family 9 domain-containing protein, partial [Candidatus Latescibacteria bacterium]|nr:carbohydrate binding family 9 domain-containing protein [Candidatus Latescibacterota bacterium]